MSATGYASKATHRRRSLPLGLATILGAVMPVPAIHAADPPASFVSDTSGKAGANGADNNDTCLTCNPNGHAAAAGSNGTAQAVDLGADADVRGGGGSPSVYIAANGGAGGTGGNAGTSTLAFGNGGDGGNAGSAGNLTVTFGGTHRIDSSSTAEAAAIVSGVGGTGGDGGNPANRGHGGTPGFGSTGSPQATVTQATGASLTSTKAGITGLLIRLDGGHGGVTQGDATTISDKAKGIDGGNAGSGGTLEGSVLSGTITSAGSGVVVISSGGDGGDGGDAGTQGLSGSTGGKGGGGGFGGDIDLTLAGTLAATGAAKPATGAGINVDSRDGKSLVKATASVVTGGLIAVSEGGLGGDGGEADGGFGPGKGGSGGNAGNGGKITLVTSGAALTTSGYGAAGIVGQSIGGGGGNGASAGAVFHSRGGSGQSGGSGAAVTLSLAGGSLTTVGDDSDGIYVQSIGGGGGYGGDVSVGGIGAAITIGGQGANGGAGSAVQLWNGYVGYDPNGNPVDQRGSQIVTSGEMSRGVVAQSIGGGGGRAGDAFSVNFGVLAQSIGGKGGKGGAAGLVTVFNNGTIQTGGSHATGVDAQSIGGGGGSGGSANSVDAGVQVTASVAVGGNGGSGGGAGAVQVDNAGQITTVGADAQGVQAQSVGGGGGHGGASFAQACQLYNDQRVPSVNLNVSLGGTGGNGGTAAEAGLTNRGAIITAGAGAEGVLAQSIGGGGGDGGDSGAFNSSFRASTVNVTTTIGGTGGTGGQGGGVEVDNAGLVMTLHDHATAVAAQSIGGGGGNGGFATASTGSYTGQDRNLQATVTIGGAGKAGGDGGAVTVRNWMTDSSGKAVNGGIVTRGDHSLAVFAQSIGGGGGNGGFSVAAGSGGTINANVGVGGNGGAGGKGGAVTLDNGAGAIATSGGDATAVYAQSVGGGGGTGGSAASGSGSGPEITGMDFIADGMGIGEPVEKIGELWELKESAFGEFDVLEKLQKMLAAYEDDNGTEPPAEEADSATTLTVDVGGGHGGKGGSGGDGGDVTVASAGDIATSGPKSEGIFAQSVGGGGGDAGATKPATSNTLRVGSHVQGAIGVGGRGGSAGHGGQVTVTNQGSIATAGDLSYGIHAQSIGGGGGAGGATVASSGTLSAFNIAIGGDGGSNGDGGRIQVEQGGRVETLGRDAAGILAQSIGGGGGLATLMTSVVPDNGGGKGESRTGLIPHTAPIYAAIGGAAGAAGDGGTVDIDVSRAMLTNGIDAYGVVAQSIGGGGGLVVGSNGITPAFPSSGKLRGNGGSVDIDVSSFVVTAGDGAVAVLAQSIGGGGGLVGGLSGVDIGQGTRPNPATQTGQGGSVTVTVDESAKLSVQGARAHGILAQSLGGGGAVVAQADGKGYVTASASPYAGCSGQACTGGVAVEIDGQVTASGADSFGVAVQSHGNGINDTSVTVSASGRIVGLGAAAAAIFVDGAGTNTIGNAGLISGSGASAGVAIAGVTPATIDNSGRIDGSIDLPGRSSFSNRQPGILSAGPTLRLARLDNAGTIEVGGAGRIGTTRLGGDLVQSPTGRIVFDTDHGRGRADRLEVAGDARIAGSVTVRPTTLSPDPVTILTAGGGLHMAPQLTFAGSHLFSYRPSVAGNALQITPEADFRSGTETGTRRGVAEHLQQIWDSGADDFGEAFAAMGSLDDADDYGAALDAMSGQAVSAIAAARLAASHGFVDNMGGCAAFVGESTLLAQADCSWGRVFGTAASRDADDRTVGFDTKAVTTQLGGQKQLGDGWFLGGSLGYELSRLDGDHDSADVDGEALLAGLMLKRQLGRLLLSGALDGGYGWYDSARTIDLGDSRQRAKGSPRAANLGLHGRIAYQLPFASWYLQPYLDLSATYVRMDGYEEHGAGALDLDVDSSDELVLSATPSVELGRRLALPDGSILRAYASGGVALYGPNNFTTDARFADAPTSTGSFRSELRNPDVAAKLGLGVEVMTTGAVDLKLQYDADLASDATAHSAMARLSWRF